MQPHVKPCWNQSLMITSKPAEPPPEPDKLEPSLFNLFREWFRIGATSFGGGVSVLHMMDTTFVQRHGWILLNRLESVDQRLRWQDAAIR